MVVELNLSADCETALQAVAHQTGQTVAETVNLAVINFVEQQNSALWLAEAERNMTIHAETLRRLGE